MRLLLTHPVYAIYIIHLICYIGYLNFTPCPCRPVLSYRTAIPYCHIASDSTNKIRLISTSALLNASDFSGNPLKN